MSSPANLCSCVPATSILNAPSNDSTAKYHWSFGKAKRFSSPKPNCEVFYDLPTTKARRNTSFGYGKKTDLQFDKNPFQVLPAPTSYNIDGFVLTNAKRQKGYSPGKGRDETAPMSYIDLEARKTPPPNAYKIDVQKSGRRWSMRPRTASALFDSKEASKIPGPGCYSRRYSVSSYKNSKSAAFNPRSSRRFSKSTTEIPGPGSYNPKNDMSKVGSYVLSNNKSAGTRAFLMSARESFVDQRAKTAQSPGPGTYRRESDFGHYDCDCTELAKSLMMKSQKGGKAAKLS